LVVLLDVLMPGMTGTALLRLVEQREPSLIRHVYLVMTALAPALPGELCDVVQHLGVPVIAKLFDVDDLVRVVEAASVRCSL
jgi:CheY-like chemotaxis protein